MFYFGKPASDQVPIMILYICMYIIKGIYSIMQKKYWNFNSTLLPLYLCCIFKGQALRIGKFPLKKEYCGFLGTQPLKKNTHSCTGSRNWEIPDLTFDCELELAPELSATKLNFSFDSGWPGASQASSLPGVLIKSCLAGVPSDPRLCSGRESRILNKIFCITES